MLAFCLSLLLAAEPPQVLFSAPLTAGPDAVHAVGVATGIVHHDGAGREAWSIRDEHDVISYLAHGNLDKRRGTIAFAFKAGWQPGDRANRILLADERNFDDKADNALRFWKWENRTLRLDLRAVGDRYLTVPLAPLEDGDWHHLAAAWDCEAGTAIYIDGKRVGARESRWEPLPAKWLNLGHGRGCEPGLGDYRNLVVYDRALGEAEVAELAAGRPVGVPARTRPMPVPLRPGALRVAPREVFRLSFDDTLASTGGRQPLRHEAVRFVPSPNGQAGWFGEQSLLEFSGERVPHERGTLMMWVRPDWSPATADGDRFFFREAPPDQPGDDCRWLWFHKDGRRIRYDLRTPGDPYVYATADTWRPGTWHHLAMSWDAGRGLFRTYLDGQPVGGRSDSKKAFINEPWTARPKERFWVGSREGRSGAQAAIDDLVMYDGVLDPAAIAAEASRFTPLATTTAVPYLAPGSRAATVNITNRGAEAVTGPATVRLWQPDGTTRDEMLPDLVLPPGRSRPLTVELSAGPGDYLVAVAPAQATPGPAAWLHLESPPPPPAAAPTERLVCDLDLTAALGPQQLVDTGDTRVVDSPLGRYREAAATKGSRFAVRLRFARLGAWHRVEWTWPDDRPRSVDVVLNRGRYDVATGTLAGAEYPNTGTMRTQSLWCWPRAEEDSLIFMTAEANRPAAAARVRVYELSGPPAAQASHRPDGLPPREVGLYYEDPVLPMNFGGEPHFPSFAEVTDRLIAYLEACGFNTLYYPSVWYHGPLYPSASQGDSQLGSRPHPSDFIRYLLGRFAARGLKLVVTFNVHDLPSLAEVETREERVRAGAPTPLSVLWNGALKTSGWHGTPGDYNPVDPAVHGAVKTLVQELAERYGDSLAFGGICFHLPRHSLLWFGQLEGGYNDLNLARFQEETGVRLELDPTDPLRANRAYRQLVGRHREAWLDWRARRLAAQWSEYAGILRQRRADLKLAINLYTVLDSTREHLAEVPPEEVDYRGEAREYGADVALLAKIPGVSLMNTFSPGLYRWERSRRPPGRPSQRVYRVSDFTPSAYGPFAGLGAPFGVNLHDKYWEDDIGRTQPLKALREWGQTELGWRVSTPVPPAPYCLENYAQALGEADVTTLTKGGFVVGTVGMEEAVRPWAAAFAALPAVPFHDLPGLADPIRVRWAARSERTWLYAQNRLPEPVTLTLRLAGAKALVRLADGVSLPLREGSLTLQLTGYELVSLGGPAGVTVVGGEVSGTALALARLRADLAKVAGAASPRRAVAEEHLREGRLARAGLVLEEPWAELTP